MLIEEGEGAAVYMFSSGQNRVGSCLVENGFGLGAKGDEYCGWLMKIKEKGSTRFRPFEVATPMGH